MAGAESRLIQNTSSRPGCFSRPMAVAVTTPSSASGIVDRAAVNHRFAAARTRPMKNSKAAVIRLGECKATSSAQESDGGNQGEIEATLQRFLGADVGQGCGCRENGSQTLVAKI